MAHALEPVADCQVLSTHERMTFRNGPYAYLITRQGNDNTYTVTDGVKTISEPLLYCFGQGKVGQTYVFKHNGSFYNDSKCLACHLSSVTEVRTDKRASPACPVSNRLCVTCHMPRVDIPEMHFKFTDHWIRLARPNDPVPR
jgi:hypothetical protein